MWGRMNQRLVWYGKSYHNSRIYHEPHKLKILCAVTYATITCRVWCHWMNTAFQILFSNFAFSSGLLFFVFVMEKMKKKEGLYHFSQVKFNGERFLYVDCTVFFLYSDVTEYWCSTHIIYLQLGGQNLRNGTFNPFQLWVFIFPLPRLLLCFARISKTHRGRRERGKNFKLLMFLFIYYFQVWNCN